MRREQSTNTFFSCGEGKISHVKFGHCTLLTRQTLKNDSRQALSPGSPTPARVTLPR
jgi:hypothetical protein